MPRVFLNSPSIQKRCVNFVFLHVLTYVMYCILFLYCLIIGVMEVVVVVVLEDVIHLVSSVY